MITTYLLFYQSTDPGVPYQVTVVAFTSAGRGVLNDDIIFFSEELVPTKFPDNINHTQLNNTSISVTWTPLSLFEARGFPLYQAVLSTKDDDTFNVIITTNTSAIFTGLDFDNRYTLVVGVTTGNNRTAFLYSSPLIGRNSSHTHAHN